MFNSPFLEFSYGEFLKVSMDLPAAKGKILGGFDMFPRNHFLKSVNA